MGRHFDFIDRLQARTALLAVGRSALRNQGAPGMVMVARKYLRAINLSGFAVATRGDFSVALDRHTKRLMKRFPQRARDNWGAARKAMNLFLREVVYNRPLCEHYGLSKVEHWLELPLDSYVYDGLTNDFTGDRDLPEWPGVKALKSSVSAKLQAAAEKIARAYGTKRVHLDVKYWRKGQIDALDG